MFFCFFVLNHPSNVHHIYVAISEIYDSESEGSIER